MHLMIDTIIFWTFHKASQYKFHIFALFLTLPQIILLYIQLGSARIPSNLRLSGTTRLMVRVRPMYQCRGVAVCAVVKPPISNLSVQKKTALFQKQFKQKALFYTECLFFSLKHLLFQFERVQFFRSISSKSTHIFTVIQPESSLVLFSYKNANRSSFSTKKNSKNTRLFCNQLTNWHGIHIKLQFCSTYTLRQLGI